MTTAALDRMPLAHADSRECCHLVTPSLSAEQRTALSISIESLLAGCDHRQAIRVAHTAMRPYTLLTRYGRIHHAEFYSSLHIGAMLDRPL